MCGAGQFTAESRKLIALGLANAVVDIVLLPLVLLAQLFRYRLPSPPASGEDPVMMPEPLCGGVITAFHIIMAYVGSLAFADLLCAPSFGRRAWFRQRAARLPLCPRSLRW